MERADVHGTPSPQEVARYLTGELGRVVAAAVAAATRGRRMDLETLTDEVRSELALRLLSGRFRGFDPSRASFATYLAAAARNVTRDLLRRETGPGPLPELTQEAPPEKRLLERERRLRVRRALRELARGHPLDARILRDRYLRGLSPSQVSRRTGVPLANLYVRAHRARQRLAGLLRAEREDVLPAA